MMKRFLILAALAGMPALAQVPGSGVIGAGGGTVGGVSGQVGVNGVGGLNSAGRINAANSINGSIRPLDDAARDSAHDAQERLSRNAPKAEAGVTRETRCYADADTARAAPYDPVYRDGAYRCESAARAGAKVRVRD